MRYYNLEDQRKAILAHSSKIVKITVSVKKHDVRDPKTKSLRSKKKEVNASSKIQLECVKRIVVVERQREIVRLKLSEDCGIVEGRKLPSERCLKSRLVTK